MTEKLKNMIKLLRLPEYRHLWLLLYWPLFGIFFWTLELMNNRTYHPMEAALDAVIPMCKWFVIPYFYWFVFIITTILYLLRHDSQGFVRYMLFVMISYSVTLIVYAVYPTCQNLRPEIIGGGFLNGVLKWLYGYDTSTNVCPSLHIIGSFAVCFAGLHSEGLKKPVWRVYFVGVTLLICAATVFIKQHSVVDVFWGAVVSATAYPLVFCENSLSRRMIGLFYAAHQQEPVTA